MTTENNKIIAEFMNTLTIDMNGVIKENLNTLKYNSDWNWIMEVVEKIESLEGKRFEIIIKDSYCYITDTKKILTLSCPYDTKIEAVYNACVEFITWYNE